LSTLSVISVIDDVRSSHFHPRRHLFISISPRAALGRCAPIHVEQEFHLAGFFELQRHRHLASCLSGAGGHQYPAAGAQGLPLLQGWVAKAPTRGSRWQIPFLTVRVSMLASSIAAYARAVDANAAAGACAPPFKTSSFG
jgi:hypothetical protein